MLTTFLIVVFFLAFFIAHIVNSSTVQSVNRLFNVEELFEEVSSINDVGYTSTVSYVRDWAEDNNFKSEVFFLLHASHSGIPAKCSGWWSDEHKLFLLVYLIEEQGKTAIANDIVTRFNGGESLTTCNSIDGLFLPRPRFDRIQFFRGKDLDEHLSVHLNAVKNICLRDELTVADNEMDLYTLMKESLRGQAQLIMELPFWKLRGVYWYFIKKYFLALVRY
jgi:hypothetical protein